MTRRIAAAIDPGYSTGGQVWLDAYTDEVLAANSYLVTKKLRESMLERAQELMGPHGDYKFAAADLQARLQAQRMAADVVTFMEQFGRPEIIAVESFNDQPSRVSKAKQAAGKAVQKDRWKVPFVIGHLSRELELIGFSVEAGTLAYQDAGRPLGGQFAVELGQLAKGGKAAEDIAPGASKFITNEHTRAAWAHAAYRALRLPPAAR